MKNILYLLAFNKSFKRSLVKSNSFQNIGGGLISKGGGGEGGIIGSIFCLQVDELITGGVYDWIWGGL